MAATAGARKVGTGGGVLVLWPLPPGERPADRWAGVCICDRCVTDARRLGAGAPVENGVEAPLRLEPSGSEVRCGFYGKETAQVRFLAGSGLTGAPGGKPGQGARICAECLDLCVEILAEPAPS